MPSKKYLSNKKISHQAISISPALKEWIKRYVNVMHNKFPHDERYKSISAFYCYVMENVLNIFEKGKSLDDFNRVIDGEIDELYEKFGFKAIIPFHELVFKSNRYTEIDIFSMLNFTLTMRKYYMDGADLHNLEAFKLSLERMKTAWFSDKLLKDAKIEFYSKKDSKYPSAIFEYSAKKGYRNLHFENLKLNAAGFGLLGAKITDFLYSEQDNYARFDLTLTDLFFEKDMALKERKTLIEHNLKFIINYNRILNDKNYYLWMKMAEDNDIIINFINFKARKRWVENIEKDLNEFGTNEKGSLTWLKFFENLHWIRIENEMDLTFQIRLSKEENEEEYDFLLNYLSKYGKIIQENGRFYLEERIT
ncbi:MAG: hypothetical protein EU532_07145 [Promethearchaeota archaeon]|nr:MAG: hypothetical protein EU532_07145 [Candidatus Lokiarchaeota archaeon]